MKSTDFSKYLSKFLTEYLPSQRNFSRNTIASYCDAFALFLSYCQTERKIFAEKLAVNDIDDELIVGFLAWLETSRGNGISTQNQRLAAIHSFFRFVQTELPANLLAYQKILAIKAKRKPRSLVNFLSVEDVQTILKQPDTSTRSGLRDLTMLSLMYDTGGRVQEIADLKVRDIRMEKPASVHLFGKGRKAREIPMMGATGDIMARYITENRLSDILCAEKPLFPSRSGDSFTRAGIAYVLKKHVSSARIVRPQLPEKISPHVMRHTKAMHLLQAGVNLVYIRDILGHVDIATTEVYARADTEMKRKALEQISVSPVPAGIPAWAQDEDLMQWLKNYGKACQ